MYVVMVLYSIIYVYSNSIWRVSVFCSDWGVVFTNPNVVRIGGNVRQLETPPNALDAVTFVSQDASLYEKARRKFILSLLLPFLNKCIKTQHDLTKDR